MLCAIKNSQIDFNPEKSFVIGIKTKTSSKNISNIRTEHVCFTTLAFISLCIIYSPMRVGVLWWFSNTYIACAPQRCSSCCLWHHIRLMNCCHLFACCGDSGRSWSRPVGDRSSVDTPFNVWPHHGWGPTVKDPEHVLLVGLKVPQTVLSPSPFVWM